MRIKAWRMHIASGDGDLLCIKTVRNGKVHPFMRHPPLLRVLSLVDYLFRFSVAVYTNGRMNLRGPGTCIKLHYVTD